MIKKNHRRVCVRTFLFICICSLFSCASNQKPSATGLNTEDNEYAELVLEHNNYKKECDTQQIAKSCFKYARFREFVEVDFKEAYNYHQKAFKLQRKKGKVGSRVDTIQ